MAYMVFSICLFEEKDPGEGDGFNILCAELARMFVEASVGDCVG
jgi:hypothetical protein